MREMEDGQAEEGAQEEPWFASQEAQEMDKMVELVKRESCNDDLKIARMTAAAEDHNYKESGMKKSHIMHQSHNYDNFK